MLMTLAYIYRHIEGNRVPCKAKVSLSEIRIPLMWKDSDHFKNKGSKYSLELHACNQIEGC